MDKNAISSAFKQYAEKETRELLPIEERIKANRLPGLDRFENVKDILQRVRKGTAEEVVGVLAGEGKSLKESLDGVHVIRDTVDEDTIKAINGARLALKEMWPTLKLRLEDDEEIKKMAEDLEVLLSSGDLYDHLTEMKNSSTEIIQRYLEIYIKSARLKEGCIPGSHRGDQANSRLGNDQGGHERADLARADWKELRGS